MFKQSADVLVVGGGIIGLAVARALAVRGVTGILLIERGEIGKESSYAAAGMIAPQSDADEFDPFFRLAAASRDLYPTLARTLLEETGIDVQLDRSGTLYLAFTSADQEEIQKRFEWQTNAGLTVELLKPADVLALEPSISKEVREALSFPLDVQVENRLVVQALAKSCLLNGVSIATDTTAVSLRTHSGRVAGVDTSRGFVEAKHVIVAGGAWTSNIRGLPAIPIEPVRGQILCFRSEGKLRHVIYSPRGSLVPRRDGRLLAGSTVERAGYEKVVSPAGMQTIRAHGLEIYPNLAALPLADSWAGLRPCAPDNLPVIGPCGEIEGLVYATGHFRNGILLAPITGELIASVVIDQSLSSLLTAFSADRFRGSSRANFEEALHSGSAQ